MLEGLKVRLKNPLFLAALAGIVYKVLKYCGVEIPQAEFRDIVDLVTWGLIGVGVYSRYDKKEP